VSSFVNRQAAALRSPRLRREEQAVSEVLGVVMLLAMVITIMGGVWVFLNPYLSDFEDNTNWKSATGIADRIEDRVEVAGNAPEGTGFRNTLAMQSTSIFTVQNIEEWTLSADFTSQESIEIRKVNDTVIAITAANESARSMTIQSPTTIVERAIPTTSQEVFINHNASHPHWMIVTVYDEQNTTLHRTVYASLSGIQVTTSLGQGTHEIVMMNNGRAERFPNGAWDVTSMPLVEFDRMANDELRLSILLTDITGNGSIGSGTNIGMEFVSLGPLTLFTGEAFNVRFTVNNALHDVITPQYHETWLSDYTIQRSAGTLDSFIGFSPYQRASGSDGFTIASQGSPLFFEVDYQRVEVSR
jgi:FlaG/FlaF family flagellin (archaellin)